MSSLVLMRILEGAPARYDAGMRLLTLGGWERAHRALAEAAVPRPGVRVLEIGCGTGALTAQLLARGAGVIALDHSPEMLERARARLSASPPERLRIEERTAAEIDAYADEGFDAVVAAFCLSEMSAIERAWVLLQSRRALRPGGLLAVADEVLPRRRWQRSIHLALRLPAAAGTWLVTGSSTHAIPDLEAETEAAGLTVQRQLRSRLGGMQILVARRPEAELEA